MSAIYSAWGFRQNPFSQTPLPATEEGAELLVGRDEEVRKLRVRLASPPKLVTVEGANGIGKTSIINVATFQCWRDFQNGGNGLAPLVPSGEVFQLSASADADDFSLQVMKRAVLTASEHEKQLAAAGRTSRRIGKLAEWMQTPVFTGSGGGVSMLGFGGSGNRTRAANTGDGFKQGGFENEAKAMLEELFPGESGGGIVCVVDNLELVKTSKAARELIEILRDRVFSVRGLRWVLSGAAGIVRGVVSTPRMSGYLYDPVEVGEIARGVAETVLKKRQEVFGMHATATLPISSADFQLLFQVLAGNIRDTLSQADIYCTDVFEEGVWQAGDSPDSQRFKKWLKGQCSMQRAAADRVVTERAWKLFGEIVQKDGQCAPGDFEALGFETQQAMRSQVLKLEEANLVQSLRDDDDNRRKTILVTSSGWLVHFARSSNFDTLFEGR